jgi:hypothetical protein
MFVYKDPSNNSVSFRFRNDTQEDLEAHKYILELWRSVPAGSTSTPKNARLRELKDVWLSEMCSLDASVNKR